MPHWEYQIYLSDVFHNEAMAYEERRDAIVDRIRTNRWFTELGGDGSTLGDLIEELAEAPDVEEFDGVWDAVYDVANADRAWIDTVSPVH